MFEHSQNNIISLDKFTERTLSCNHPAIKKRVLYLSKLDYAVYGHKDASFSKSMPIFTIILLLYNGNIKYIKESLDSVFNQTYINTEIIIIDNGTTGSVADLIKSRFYENTKVKLISLYKNLYDPASTDFLDPIPNLWNAGLFCSIGNYVFFLSYDDRLSADYVERMVELFRSNPKCCTAAPQVVSINEKSEINTETSNHFAANNCRSRYTNGIVLAQSYMRGSNLICFPGGLLAQKSDIVLEFGGFDKINDLSQLMKFAIHGDSGFDPKAKLYWRHHSSQANKIQKQMGFIYYRDYIEFSERHNIYELHKKVAGTVFADEFSAYLKELASKQAISSFRDSYRYYGFVSGISALKRVKAECPPTVVTKVIYYLVQDFPLAMAYNHLPNALSNFLRKEIHKFWLILKARGK